MLATLLLPSRGWAEADARLAASDGAASDRFGYAVAADANTVVVGVPFDDGGAGADQGAVYVYTRPTTGWAGALVEVARLTPSDGVAGATFGVAVAIGGDTIVVGASGPAVGGAARPGAVYVFVRPAGGWSGTLMETGKLIAADGRNGDELGSSVAIAGDLVLAGASFDDNGTALNQGAAYVFQRPTGGWSGEITEAAKLSASDGVAGDLFGADVAIAGVSLVVGAPYADIGGRTNQGAAYVFQRPAGGWAGSRTEDAKLSSLTGLANDNFGYSLAAVEDTVVPCTRKAISPNRIGGTAHVFLRPGGGWAGSLSEQARLMASDEMDNDQFGTAVGMDGASRVVVGSPLATVDGNVRQGAVYLYNRPATGWAGTLTEAEKLTAGTAGDSFGLAVAFGGGDLAVGAPLADVTPNSDQGQVHLFVFAPPPVERILGVDVSGPGAVTSDPPGIDCPPDCSQVYTEGTVVTLTALPAPDAVFSGWSGDADCSDGQVTMDVDVECTATFTPRLPGLAINMLGFGRVTSDPAGIDCVASCGPSFFPRGTVVTLTATPDLGYELGGWSGDPDCQDGRVTLDDDRTCTAVFTPRANLTTPFHRGDTDGSNSIEITDAIATFLWLFLGGAEPACLESADFNDDGRIDISDGIGTLAFLFLGGAAPKPPGPPGSPCGLDPESSPGHLGCREYPPCAAPPGPGIILDAVADKTMVCPGESMKVTVATQHPDGEGKPVEVSINGQRGSERHLQFLGIPGPRRIFVAATTAEGYFDSRELTVEVLKCDPAAWLPRVRVAANPFHPGTVDFVVTNAADLAGGAGRYVWEYGDGVIEETTVPHAAHRYGPPGLLRDEPFTVFQATITVKPNVGPQVSQPKTVTVHNPYALDKRAGRIRPLAEWDARLARFGPYLAGRFTLTNLEDELLVFTERRLVYQSCDPALDPAPAAAPEEILLQLGSRERFSSSLVLAAASVPPDICGLAVHLSGFTSSGSPALASLYFEVRQNPFLTEMERDYDVLQTLNAVAGQRLVADTNRITDEQLYTLANEERIEFPVRGRFELGGGGDHLPAPDLGDECAPGQPLRDGLTCAATAEWRVIHGFIANARKGELVLSPACGMIGAMLRELPNPQLFSHIGIMTAHGVEIAHSTTSEERMSAHRIEIEGPFGIDVPTGGIDPTVLQFQWPGAIVQSVEDAFRGRLLTDPDGDEYTIGSFAWGPVSCDGDATLIAPRIVKPSRDMEEAVTPALHDAAEAARSISRDEGTHYRFFAYTRADLHEEAACVGAPHEHCEALCDHCLGTMCSSFIWRSFKDAGVDLVEPEDAGDPHDGLFAYEEEARRAAATFLGTKISNDIHEEADDFEDVVVDWLSVAERTVNQVLNCFARDDCNDLESTGWRDPGPGLTVSPDDTERWDSVYGDAETIVFRPAQWVRVHRAVATAGTGDIRGRVVDLEGRAVEGAEVTVDVHGVAAALTDAGGAFRFDAIPSGLRQIRATKQIDGLQHESCSVGADFDPPAADCGLADVRARETADVDLVLGPPSSSLRCVAISILSGSLLDHDSESRNEHGQHEDFGTVHLAPVIHVHDDLEAHDHGQGTLSFRSSCVDDEMYVNLDFNVSLIGDGAVQAEVRVRLYEGASCGTEDKDTDRTFDLGAIEAGATTPILDFAVENEDEGGDRASYRVVISNLRSDECSSGR